MKTKAMFPVGSEYKTVERGDIIELVTGEKVTFLEMKRTKWLGVMNGRNVGVPIYRDRQMNVPYAKAIVGKDKSVITPGAKLSSMRPGQLFAIEGHKETFLYVGTETKPNGKNIIRGHDLASGRMFNIESTFKLIKIDVNKIKKERLTK